MAGIYIHVPFCKQACHYCNFYFSTSKRWYDDVVNSMMKEIQRKQSFLSGQKIESIYFGGGTPSLLKIEDLQRIIGQLQEKFDVANQVEYTLEANPDDLTAEYIQSLRQTPINRLSIGTQSFFNEDLEWMNRAHNAEEADRSIRLCQDAGFDNLTIDLIFGIPVSNNQKWQENIEKAIELKVPHLSCYALTVEPQTALHVRIQKNLDQAPDDQETTDQFYLADKLLTKNGYGHYEISNYAKPGMKAVHNSNYWTGVPYLGIGPSAHSFDGDNRYWNVASNKKYIEKIADNQPWWEQEQLSKADRYNEFVMVSLRTAKGISIKKLQEQHPEFVEYFDYQLTQIDQKLIDSEGAYCKVSQMGYVYADRIASDLFWV